MKKANLNNLTTTEDLIDFAIEKFTQEEVYFGHGTDNACDEAVYLVMWVLGFPKDSDKEILLRKLTDDEKDRIIKLIDARIKKRVPIAYLTKESWFMGLPFYVDERVLIPRSPLAELIQNQFVPWIDPVRVKNILDIGTGSGCIAIGSAYSFPEATVDAVDISDDALDVAKVNCRKFDLKERVNLIKSDIFEEVRGKSYDIIVSNPPYVGSKEMKDLPKEYYHEPEAALLAGVSGDEIVDRIIKDAAKYLSPQGILVVEVGNSASLLEEKYRKVPFTWLEFENGEAEVFLLTKEQLEGGVESGPIAI